MLYRIFEKTGDQAALQESLKKYREARSVWAEMVAISKPVYKSDITVGEHPHLRGHWADRLPAINADIALVEKKLDPAKLSDGSHAALIKAALSRPRRTIIASSHAPAATFRPGQPLDLELSVAKTAAPVSAHLYYRHVTHEERYQSTEMELKDGRYRATIPARYTDSAYPLEYYFELKQGSAAWLYPGFNAERTNQPYFVVRRA